MSTVERVPASDWEDWVAHSQGAVLDVREPHEWNLGTLPGALTISMSQLLQRVDELDQDQPLLIVCRSGSRSMQVALYLAAQGYQTANMEGGMKALGMQS